jgi:DTW domain-containing protein YfiP
MTTFLTSLATISCISVTSAIAINAQCAFVADRRIRTRHVKVQDKEVVSLRHSTPEALHVNAATTGRNDSFPRPGGSDDNDIPVGDSDSLSHWLSSPERFADRLHMTLEEVEEHKKVHRDASQALHDELTALSPKDGQQKHQIMCEYRFVHGKGPFVCPQCWCYRPICLCHHPSVLESKKQLRLPSAIKSVILWTHHNEWMSVSNSGSLLQLLLPEYKLLMKGLPRHDEQIEELFQKAEQGEEKLVVLWPDNNTSEHAAKQTISEESSMENRATWQELQEMMEDTESGVTLLALEGTWRTARRMASKLPPSVLRVALPPDTVFWRNHSHDDKNDNQLGIKKSSSMLQPLRRQAEGGSEDNLCTAEAMTAALVGLGMPEQDGDKMLQILQLKVDLVRRYQGKRLRE